MSVTSISTIGSEARVTERPQSVEAAAQAFEAMFLGQLLRMAREAEERTQLGEGDVGGSTMMEVAEEHLAAEVARSGGLGFAKTVIEQMRR
ncbi:MAG: hypothetical protein JNL98_25060 [Bryobacterales bacterium]|nr:hypothetical protein [Bryobacterales bacterium]